MGERVRRVFVDTAWNRKPHACYDPLTDEFFEVQRLTDLKGYEEIYIDSLLFPGIWNELRELIIVDRCEVYYFAKPWKWKEVRRRFSDGLKRRFKAEDVKKTDFGDAYLLCKVYETGVAKRNLKKWFRRVTAIDIELKPLLTMEKVYEERLRKARQLATLEVDMKDDIGFSKDKVKETRKRIITKAREIWPKFIDIAARLGLDEENFGGLIGLAGVLTYLQWPLRRPSICKASHYLGLYRPCREDKMRFTERTGKKFRRYYSGTARRYLNMLTTAIIAKERKFPPKIRDEREILRKLIETLRELESDGSRRGESRTMPRFG